MLIFINSKLPDDWQISVNQYHIFQKSTSYKISNTEIYWWGPGIYYSCILLGYLIRHCLYNSGIKVDILDTCGRYIKVDILDTCGAMICSYFRVAFLLFFKKIENAVYTSCQNSTLLFINAMDWFFWHHKHSK